MVPCKSTAEEVSFEWSHHRISSTESKVRAILHVAVATLHTLPRERMIYWGQIPQKLPKVNLSRVSFSPGKKIWKGHTTEIDGCKITLDNMHRFLKIQN